MSLYKTINLPPYQVDLLDNWVAWLHSGKSVVPRDFHREVDRFEARADPDPLRGRLVDGVYIKYLRHNPSQARVVVALCMGARVGFLRSMRMDALLVRVEQRMQAREGGYHAVNMPIPFGKRDAEALLRQFAREVGEINVDAAMAAELAKISRATPMRTIKEFRFAARRVKVGSREWMDEQSKADHLCAVAA